MAWTIEGLTETSVYAEKGSVHKNCLQAATVPIISNEECQEMYSRSNKRIGRGNVANVKVLDQVEADRENTSFP